MARSIKISRRQARLAAKQRRVQLIMPADQPQLVTGPGPKPLPPPKVKKLGR